MIVALDRDVKMLRGVCRIMEKLTPKMRKATLDFAYDKYVTNAGSVKSFDDNDKVPL